MHLTDSVLHLYYMTITEFYFSVFLFAFDFASSPALQPTGMQEWQKASKTSKNTHITKRDSWPPHIQ